MQEVKLIADGEGGYYRERVGEDRVKRGGYSSIYLVLRDENICDFEGIEGDEVWYDDAGERLSIEMIRGEGKYDSV
ncbi:cupin domain-containing protein, partial [Staphylococcus capitis]|uniref:cupin domain-containing protein n=1 Tax=Staphylococcus capitis TaxID=29388 RepID=UPI00370478D2